MIAPSCLGRRNISRQPDLERERLLRILQTSYVVPIQCQSANEPVLSSGGIDEQVSTDTFANNVTAACLAVAEKRMAYAAKLRVGVGNGVHTIADAPGATGGSERNDAL